MEEIDIQNSYAEFLKDSNFQKLEILSDNPNIFDILKVEKYEIRHSNFLAWLLNPKGNHGLGSRFLKMFLFDLALDEKSKGFSVLNVQNLDYSNVEIFREWKNIDIVLIINDIVIAIENKINHFETEGQLSKYRTAIENTFHLNNSIFVFLNPYGHEASCARYINFSYQTIANNLDQILELNKSILSRTKIYIEDYLDNLKNIILDNGEKNMLVNQIYLQHKDFIDYIIQNKSSELQKIRILLENLIKQKGWILGSSSKKYLRFLTSDLDKIIPKKVLDRDWKEGEAFLFQVDFVDNRSEIITCCAISPCEKNIRQNLLEILGNKNKSKNWLIYNNKNHNIKNKLKAIDCDYESIAKEIMKSLEEMVNEIEPKLLDNKNKFIQSITIPNE
jgi:hypothetical protein